LSGVDRRPRSSESPQDSFRRNNPPLDSSVRIESPAIPHDDQLLGLAPHLSEADNA
jgi:hypothetical protein